MLNANGPGEAVLANEMRGNFPRNMARERIRGGGKEHAWTFASNYIIKAISKRGNKAVTM
jgi:hypothetical protein